MKYILEKNILLCGYKNLPFAYFDVSNGRTSFTDREKYALILDCDGKTEISPEEQPREIREYFEELVERKIIRPASDSEELEDYQKYRFFDNRFKEEVHFSVTGDCNYRCKHCFMSAPDAKFGIPTTEELFDWIDQMADCGIRKAGITGGEPLVRKDFLQLIRHMQEKGIVITTIYTNGALVNEKLLDGLDALNTRPAFQISFDGVGWHDWLRGIPGAEQKVYDAITLLKKRGFRVACTMVVHKNNADTIRESANKLAELGCSSLKLGRATDLGCWSKQGDYSLSAAECRQIYLDYIDKYVEDGFPITLAEAGEFTFDKQENKAIVGMDKGWNIVGKDDEKCMGASLCGVVRTGMYLSPEGKVLPCMSMIDTPIAEKFSSLREKSLHDILNEGYYIECSSCVVKDLTEHNKKCKDCEYIGNCFGGCRAVAVQTGTMDYLAIDEETCQFFLDGWYDKFKAKCDEINKKIGAVKDAQL